MKFLIPLAFLFYALSADSQQETTAFSAFISQNFQQVDLKKEDTKEFLVSSHHRNQQGYTYIYSQQVLESEVIENAIFNLVLNKADQIVHYHNGWYKDLHGLKVESGPALAEEKTIAYAAAALGIQISSLPKALSLRKKEIGAFNRYQIPAVSLEPIQSRSIWILYNDRLKLSQEVQIYDKDRKHLWQIMVDRSTGEILRKRDQVIQCNFGLPADNCSTENALTPHAVSPVNFLTGTDMYNVFPLTVESPGHGMRQLIIGPADGLASPFGWHDTDGIEGSEYTDTRGNNAQVQEDIGGRNNGGKRADGGQELVFDYDLNFSIDPKENLDASLTNLFYWVNINHDIFYHYGFDEAAGNYQVNNYGALGLSGDPVFADALDGSDENNARFFPSSDGSPGRLEMYIWKNGQSLLSVVGDQNLNVQIIGIESSFSFINRLEHKGPITGNLIVVKDQNSSVGTVCNGFKLENETDIKGNIVLIDRGNCTFVEKVRRMESLGAIAVIVCNNTSGNPFSMGGDGDDITIPAVMLASSDCFILKNALNSGEKITATMSTSGELKNLDSSLDNLVISHEYGHGISTRLTGGANTSTCLNNNEQMGEGWSDYFGLMLTTDWSTATPEDIRGVGTWLLRQELDGGGIRPYPYSYSLSINPLNYKDIGNLSIPHGVGSAWCAMLWDMTWNIIAEEGVSTDLYNGEGGNNIALRIVVEGLKLQACNPGFADGRDAILRADKLLYEGKHHYAIWKAFARRGLGSGSNQNSSFSTKDGKSSTRLPAQFKTKISSFIAKDSLLQIVINWTTEREFNNHQFILERSTDKFSYQIIGTFPGLAKSLNPRTLKYVDKDVLPGILYYYRIKEENESGISLNLGEDQAIIVLTNDLAIYPNPVSTGSPILLKLAPAIKGIIDLELINSNGQIATQVSKVNANLLHSTYTWPVSDLPPGIYYIQVITEQKTFSKKLLVL